MFTALGSNLVVQAIRSMTNPTNGGCDEVCFDNCIIHEFVVHNT